MFIDPYQNIIDKGFQKYFFYKRKVSGEITHISSSQNDILGYTLDEFSEIHQKHPTVLAINKFYLEKNEETVKSYQLEILKKNGSMSTFEFTEKYVKQNNDESIDISGIAYDNTHCKFIMQTLRKQEERLGNLVKCVPGAIYQASNNNGSRYIFFINHFFEQITGYNVDSILHERVLTYESMIHPQDVAMVTKTIADASITYGEFSLEYRLLHRDGTIKWVLDSGHCTNANIASEHIGSINGIIFDITEKKQQEIANKEMRAQLVLSERLASLGTLAAGIAHELNNPLTVIKFGLEEIQESAKEKNSSEHEVIFKQIQRNLDRMSKIITHLRSFFRSSVSSHGACDIHEILDDVFILLGNFFVHDKIAIKKDFAPEVLISLCDRYQIEQVFVNILLNARDALEKTEHKNIIITTCVKNSFVVITFNDNGCGIPIEAQNKIYDPFFTTKDVGKGTGLGLFTAKGIIDSHQGMLQLLSSSAMGSVFEVMMPLLK